MLFDPAPPDLRLVSALAEGADRIAAKAALEAGWTLEVVLPFATEEYEQDFDSPESKEAFPFASRPGVERLLSRHAAGCRGASACL